MGALELNSPLKLHLGCGRNIMSGWVNLDIAELPGVDIVHDLDDLDDPLPVQWNSVDEFLMSHVLEHLADPLSVLNSHHPGKEVQLEPAPVHG